MNSIARFSLLIAVVFTFQSSCFAADPTIETILNTAADLSSNLTRNGTTNTTSTTTTTSFPITSTSTIAPGLGADGHFRYNYSDTEQYCLMMDVSSLILEITYETKLINGSRGHSSLSFKAPPTAGVSSFLSSCGKNYSDWEVNETLVLTIPLDNSTFPLSTAVLTFHFTRSPNITGDSSKDKRQLWKISASVLMNPFIFVNTSEPGTSKSFKSNETLKEFVVLKDRSYQCNSGTTIKVDDDLTLKFTGLRVQSFVANNHFDAPEPCPADSTSSDLVPIIIGAVLAAIVLIVLIAYLVGRARMRRTTYETI